MKKLIFLITVFMVVSGYSQGKITSDKLIEVASFGNNQPIGVTVSKDNRLFVSFPHKEPFLYGLTEIIDGKKKAFSK